MIILAWDSHLFVYFWFGHLLKVLQVGVKQAASGQRDTQNRLDDVANGTVIRETDLLSCVHEMASTVKSKKEVRSTNILN